MGPVAQPEIRHIIIKPNVVFEQLYQTQKILVERLV
jgi:hypothetical protein